MFYAILITLSALAGSILLRGSPRKVTFRVSKPIRLFGLTAFSVIALAVPASAVQLQERFTPLSEELATPSSFTAGSGRTVHYGTIGPVGGQPVLVLNGSPTNWATVDLLAPYRSLLEALDIRIIHPERTGTGITPYVSCSEPYTDCMTPEKYSDDWSDLMHGLGYRNYSVLAMSTGGLYADHFVKRYGSEVRSLHLSSAVDSSPQEGYCPMSDPAGFRDALQPFFDYPSLIWYLFPERDFATVSSVPGMVDWFGRMVAATPDAIGASHDVWVGCNFPVGDLSDVKTPVYIYHGVLDATVPLATAEHHSVVYKNVVKFQTYPNDAHFSSLRHLGQTLLDINQPAHQNRLVCDLSKQQNDGVGKTRIVNQGKADKLFADHEATEDICAWVGTPGE